MRKERNEEGTYPVRRGISARVRESIDLHLERQVDLAVTIIFLCAGRVAKVAEGGTWDDIDGIGGHGEALDCR